jgi:hypothetical protein
VPRPYTAGLNPAAGVARIVLPEPANLPLATCAMRPRSPEKPTWVDTLEESLLLAIGLFTLITWIVTVGLLAH